MYRFTLIASLFLSAFCIVGSCVTHDIEACGNALQILAEKYKGVTDMLETAEYQESLAEEPARPKPELPLKLYPLRSEDDR